jgi:hypothetical protein
MTVAEKKKAFRQINEARARQFQQREASMMRMSEPVRTTARVVLLVACTSCATPAGRGAYDAFLDKIAVECKPLIIGSDNLTVAISTIGSAGTERDHYHDFLSATKALNYGNIPGAVYRNSLTAQLGRGPYNDQSFDCIVAHLPKS